MSNIDCQLCPASYCLRRRIFQRRDADSQEDSQVEGNSSLEELECGWEESKESQPETEFEDTGFGDLQEDTENLEEITVES